MPDRSFVPARRRGRNARRAQRSWKAELLQPGSVPDLGGFGRPSSPPFSAGSGPDAECGASRRNGVGEPPTPALVVLWVPRPGGAVATARLSVEPSGPTARAVAEWSRGRDRPQRRGRAGHVVRNP